MDYSSITQVFEAREISFLRQKYEGDEGDSHIFYRLVEAYRKQGDLKQVKDLLKNNKVDLGSHHRSLLSLFEGECFLGKEFNFSPVPYRVFHNPFSNSFQEDLWAVVNQCKNEFKSARVYSNDKSRVDKTVRSSLAIYDKHLGELKDKIHAELKSYFKQYTQWLNAFQIAPLNDDLELEVNVYTEGRGFKRHRDKGEVGAGATREVTFVYYFFMEPQKFKGGDLLLFDYKRDKQECNDNFLRLRIENNMLVLFPSDCYHQVTEISTVANNSLVEGRCTLNGWAHRRG
ncbi:2OG-Fe(II) oxygenase [Lentisphaera marina]|uniref:2OG-Fe(II) oxygenase n=1 Tax=Lentisphaera marina TaxID=1111041 RepID=UPI0023662E70|nr:2OG-Fe(II) oxygenase [Lentisphaera marina]MDD7987010.1 2OG-Fe(II) oxygenase [Lentisphaera marina]